jgi:hypothetical protein
MPPRLYARDPVLRALVPRLVGLGYDRRALVPMEHRDDLPVTLLTGRRGVGRTAVLDALEGAYRGRVPVARVDTARLGRASGSGAAVSNTSDVVEALEHLVCELAPVVPGAVRLRFARLLPGLLSVSSWHRGAEAEQQLARDRIARLLVACGLQPESAGPGSQDSDWTYDVSERLADPRQQQHDLAPVATAVIHQYFTRHTRTRVRRSVEDWYHSRSAGSEDGESALIRLSLRFHQGGDFQHAAERLLTAAFLDDLSDAYGRWQHLNRVPRPLALLDNTHTPAGRRLLGLLLERRAEAPDGGRDPLVVVATRRGDGSAPYPDATVRRLPEVAVTSGWARSVPGSASAGVLAIALPPLSRDDILSLLDAAEGPVHRYVPSALHALTRGHPQAAGLLCAAVVRVSGQRMVEPDQLLDLPGPDGQRVGELLLERLIPQPQLRAPLMWGALARDPDAAQALAEAHPMVGTLLPAAARFLEEEHGTDDRRHPAAGPDGGPRPSAGGFVGDPFLRALLEHEARRTAAAAGPGQTWQDLHRLLRDHHTRRGAGEEPDILRHTLATGDAAAVVTRLSAHFALWEAGRWLDTLRYTATAPCPPPGEWTEQRVETGRGGGDRRYADADDVQRSVNRLLHVLWYLSETFAEPVTELCDAIGAELTFLSMRHPSGHAVLNEAARTWPAAVHEQRLYPR